MPDELQFKIITEVLSIAKDLVYHDLFELVPRRKIDSLPVTNSVAKYLFSQLRISDYKKREEDYDRPNEFVWIFHEEDDDITYYIKFKLLTAEEVKKERLSIPKES